MALSQPPLGSTTRTLLASLCTLVPVLTGLFNTAGVGMAAEIEGKVQVLFGDEELASLEKSSPLPGVVVTLCSTQRVYRVEGVNGRFAFHNVAAGDYEVVAVAASLAPQSIMRLKVESNDELFKPMSAVIRPGQRTHACYINSHHENGLRDHEVSYSAPDQNRSSPSIEGRVSRYTRKGSRELSNARVSLYREGSSIAILSTTSDKSGYFKLEPEPGIYDLKMERKGYYDALVKEVLVPKENVTAVEIFVEKAGLIVVYR